MFDGNQFLLSKKSLYLRRRVWYLLICCLEESKILTYNKKSIVVIKVSIVANNVSTYQLQYDDFPLDGTIRKIIAQ